MNHGAAQNGRITFTVSRMFTGPSTPSPLMPMTSSVKAPAGTLFSSMGAEERAVVHASR